MEDKTIERLYISSLIVLLIIASLYFNNPNAYTLILAVISFLAGIITPTKFITNQLLNNKESG